MFKIHVTFKDGELLTFKGKDIDTNDNSHYLIIECSNVDKSIVYINLDEIRFYKVVMEDNNG